MTVATIVTIPEFDQERYDSGAFTGVLEIMDSSGDTKVLWDVDNEAEVAETRRIFDSMIAESGMLAYKTESKNTSDGEVIKEFDATAERVVLSPQLVGG